MVVEGEVFGGGIHRHQLQETTTIILPLHNLYNRLAHIPPEKYYPLITQGYFKFNLVYIENPPEPLYLVLSYCIAHLQVCLWQVV